MFCRLQFHASTTDLSSLFDRTKIQTFNDCWRHRAEFCFNVFSIIRTWTHAVIWNTDSQTDSQADRSICRECGNDVGEQRAVSLIYDANWFLKLNNKIAVKELLMWICVTIFTEVLWFVEIWFHQHYRSVIPPDASTNVCQRIQRNTPIFVSDCVFEWFWWICVFVKCLICDSETLDANEKTSIFVRVRR